MDSVLLTQGPELSEKALNPFPRGVSPQILFQFIHNTVPFLFEKRTASIPGEHLRIWNQQFPFENETSFAEHADYFFLCLCAHHTTVGSYVPTDVDNQIRFRLWYPALPIEVIESMAERVLESRHWDPAPVCGRVLMTEHGAFSGGNGEWFSTAAAAYAATKRRSPRLAQQILEEIVTEVARHAAIMSNAIHRRDGLYLGKVAGTLSHNLGDLDRVIEQWQLPEEDALRSALREVGHGEGVVPRPEFQLAGILNRNLMAPENHRFYSLRKPKCLRRSPEFLMTFGPFLDDWGRKIATSPLITEREVGEVVEALVDGWVWFSEQAEKSDTPLPVPVGFGRAIAGMASAVKGGLKTLQSLVPSRIARRIGSGELYEGLRIPQDRFEASWSQRILNESKRKNI